MVSGRDGSKKIVHKQIKNDAGVMMSTAENGENSLLLIFSSITISSIRRYVNAHVFMHTKLYKGAWNVSANNSETVGHKDLRLGQIVCTLVFYNISFSWFLPLDGFQFIFLLRDSENDLYRIYLV